MQGWHRNVKKNRHGREEVVQRIEIEIDAELLVKILIRQEKLPWFAIRSSFEDLRILKIVKCHTSIDKEIVMQIG